MNKLLILIFSSAIHLTVYSQEGKIPNHLNYYVNLIKESISKDEYEKAKLYSDTSIMVTNKTTDSTYIAYLMRSLTFTFLKSYDSSKYYLNLINKDFNNDSTSSEAAVYFQINGLLNQHQGDYKTSSAFFEKEKQNLRLYPEKKKQRCAATINLAVSKMLSSDYIVAIEYFNKANRIAEQIKDTTLQLKSLANMGVCYSYLKEYDKSAKIQQNVLELASLSNNTRMAYFAHANLGTQYHQTGEINKAKHHLQICINNQEYKVNKRICLFTMSYILRDEGKLDSAIIISKKVLEMNERQKNIHSIIKSKHQLGELYRKKGSFNKASKLFDEALSLSIAKNDLYSQAYIYDALINVEIDKKELWNLSKNWTNYRNLKDTLYSINVLKAVAESEQKYQTKKKEAENELLKKEQDLQTATIKQQRVILTSVIIIAGLIGLFAFFIYRRSQERGKTNQQLASQKDEIETLHKELSHRVKNNLLFMASLLHLQGKSLEEGEAKQAIKEGEARLEAMSLLHRRLGLDGNSSNIHIGDYLKEICSYLKVSFPQSNNPKISVESEDIYTTPEYAMRLGIIVNELVTNSIKHAFDKQPQPSIKTTLKNEPDGRYTLHYKDNGKGLPEGFVEKPDSLGMKLIHTLTRQLQGTISVGNEEGTSLTFIFDKITKIN